MWTNRNILLTIGGVAIGGLAFFAGRIANPAAEAIQAPDDSVPAAAPAPSAAARVDGASGGKASRLALPNPSSTADLATRLQTERAGRRKLEPTSESVFAAMTNKLGVKIEARLQVAGFIVGAGFCDKVRTGNDVHVVVCEFMDEPSAIAGVASAENKSIKNREVLRNKTTTCAIHQADPKTGAKEAEKIKALFMAM